MNATAIDKNANTAEYHRPEWMTDAQWRQVSADLTEVWIGLLDAAARPAVGQPVKRSDVSVG